jgi:shikimate kinase/3-dehydroquinate synthase
MNETVDPTRTEASGAPLDEAGLRAEAPERAVVRKLAGRSVVLVGMMGAGKTSVGKRLAVRLGLDFIDADAAIEAAAGLTIPEIFARHGEPHFRDGERRVISRLLGERQRVLATGGGAFMNKATRDRIAETSVSVWLKADADVLLRRVRKRNNRPMLNTPDPEDTLKRLMAERYPVYALADITVVSRDGPHEAVVDAILEELDRMLSVGHDIAPDTIVPVELAERRYDIHIGQNLLVRTGEFIRELDARANCFIITDRHLADLHLPALEKSLTEAQIRHSHYVIEPGEASKSYEVFAQVCDAVIEARMERGDLIIALGGGVVGDLAGFVASCIRRGMRFVQIPTSVLAQVDSSVGGKTAINSPHGKNLVGAFHQPSLVLADTGVLQTLDPREFRAGYAEIAKYGLIDDAPFFGWLEQNWRSIFAFGPELAEAIRVSCRSKAAVVARDETEQGDRALLNLGHTFGHALEALNDFDTSRLVHGEGVAIGMTCAFRFSARLGHASASDAERVEAHLRAVGLPTRIRDVPGLDVTADQILDAMFQDKKVSRGALTFILARGIGQSFIAKGVPAEDVRAFLADELSGT